MNKTESHPKLASTLSIAVLSITTALPAVCPAIQVEFPLVHRASITDESGMARYLFDPGDISSLDGELVTSAVLDVPLSGAEPSEEIQVFVTALGTEWVGRAATWTSPWAEAGGDLDKTYSSTTSLAAGRPATRLVIDVTQFVRDMADDRAAKNGFLLTCPGEDRDGFNAAEAAVLGTLEGATLRVRYTKISALGYRDGSLSFRD